MLRTLFIEEARTQLARNAAVLGLCALVFAGFLGLWWLLADVPALAALLQTGAMVALVAMPLVVMSHLGAEYWQSMYGDRGYLTQMIPVRGRTHFAAKLSYACLVALVVAVLTQLGIFAWMAVMAHAQGVALSEIFAFLRELWETLGAGKTAVLVGIVTVGLLASIIEIAAVMSIGAQSRYSHLGFGAPLLGFVALYVVNQLLGLAAVALIPLSVDVATGDLTAKWMLPQLVQAIRTGTQPTLIGVGSTLVGPLLAAGLSWWAVRAIERHTSLR
ncbi:Uncharacterised protein [Actinomyces bovis]|uniref:ABC-2 family transporter protein n=1 Tax=Actinomyces bovis TaxID=1658 RepID=A0ABY1VLS3_9ACTO|nr:hypothetical protein [Actinomyces bovis]SPT52763.1 Uncharacterised protein [Actinomyces bovis]VEG54771.1 Uncharacterised protein [Actinomyces israelii]